MKTVVWDKDSTLINETINVPRKSMRAIVMLFSNPMRKESEEFQYPKIESVKITVEGVPNTVYGQLVTKKRMFEEAQQVL